MQTQKKQAAAKHEMPWLYPCMVLKEDLIRVVLDQHVYEIDLKTEQVSGFCKESMESRAKHPGHPIKIGQRRVFAL